jgi:hypothetical protein
MDGQRGLGRREFFGKAAVLAATVAAVLNSTSRKAQADNNP